MKRGQTEPYINGHRGSIKESAKGRFFENQDFLVSYLVHQNASLDSSYAMIYTLHFFKGGVNFSNIFTRILILNSSAKNQGVLESSWGNFS